MPRVYCDGLFEGFRLARSVTCLLADAAETVPGIRVLGGLLQACFKSAGGFLVAAQFKKRKAQVVVGRVVIGFQGKGFLKAG
ncbi:MAG: hypothetical protein BWX80_00905 [Candidatus Hydrogenedentes bacterium ADurb.Bin101]|nr:MAG: hypothetical protein BWX80_00905 [Candidatus Hydrogenedentes bacterium ADurb.Bin101]